MVYRHRDNKKIFKRDLDVFGIKSTKFCLTLWESLATKEGQDLEEFKDELPVIMAKSIIGRYFNGFTLSTTSSSTIEINPELPEIKELKDWYLENKDSLKISKIDFVITDLLQINTCEHSCGEMKFYDTNVSIKGIKEEGNIWYDACDTCKSKVTINDDSVECAKCNQKDVQHSLRYLIKLLVEDLSSTAIFTIFDDEAEEIIGIPVIELQKLKEEDTEEYNKVLRNFIGSTKIFSVKAQDKVYGSIK